MLEEIHPALAELIESRTARGFLTYDELNTVLPDELVDPERIDELMACLDVLGIRLVESSRDPSTQAPEPTRTTPLKPILPATPRDEESEAAAADEDSREIGQDLAQALQEAGDRRIDDPVRMYLTQMGEISLLTRDEEIRLAKKIEVSRMIFRRKVLENDYSIVAAVEILELVHDGDLPFDRTMKI